MCMLTYFPPNTQPDTNALRNGTMFNRDGHGYAIVVPGRKAHIIVRHSLNADYLIDEFAKDRALHPEGAALFHSRIGTSGDDGKFNCHPFYVAGDKRTVVAHNGILPQHMLPLKGDPRCDTRKAADERFASAYGHLSGRKARKRLSKDIGLNNKLVILTVDPSYQSQSFVINEGSGVWEQGIWYSNYDFEDWTPPQKKYPVLAFWATNDRDDDCPLCRSKESVDAESQVCTMCESCLDCGAGIDDCICYWTPAAWELREATVGSFFTHKEW